MQLIPVTAPAAAPIALDDLKARLGIGDSDSDVMLAALISAATMALDGPLGCLGRALVTQSWDMVLDGWPDCERRLVVPLPPLISVTSIAYVDRDGATQTWSPAAYRVTPGTPGVIRPVYGTFWPALRHDDDAVTVRFQAGYGDPAAVPEPIRSAMVMQIRHLMSLNERNLFLLRDKVDGVSQQDFAVTDMAGQMICDAADALLTPYKVYL